VSVIDGRRSRHEAAPDMPAIGEIAAENRPFWSVMIPSYNSASLLGAALESVLSQDEGPEVMQIEVVDDASTLDDPAEVVSRLAGERVAYFRQPFNVGASANFTSCIRRSTGRWVHILHSDDLVQPGFYERYRARIDTCPDALMVGARTIAVDADGRHLALTEPVATESGYVVDPAFTMATANPLRCVSVVVARRAYEQAGGFHPFLAHANDWEMWTRVASRGPVGWVDEALGLYRMHEASDTNRLHRSTAYLDDCLLAAEIIAGHFPPASRARARVAARRSVYEYALSVGTELLEHGHLRLAAANGLRALRIAQSAETRRRAGRLVSAAVTKRAARRPGRESAPAGPSGSPASR
jgi:glycosyltransferase involved in cell wall biosynthesis